jgi:predicted nucleotidyltransferase
MVDETITRIVQLYIRELNQQGLSVQFGVIFGSQVTGKSGKWSDIDLLVVSPRFDGKRQRKDIDLLWRVAARTDSRIEPIPAGVCQYEEDDGSAIIEIARREGHLISTGLI